MTKIRDEAELKERLCRDVADSGARKLVLQAGHFPLLYKPDGIIEGLNRWGHFSPYSLELGCEIGRVAREMGKEVEFVFFVDDHSYEPENASRKVLRRMRNEFYKEKSGEEARVHPVYKEIMGKAGFGERDVLRHDHERAGRTDCLYFSEKILRSSERQIENVCAREYTEFLENPKYLDKSNSYLVSFVPNRCKGHVCDVALDLEIEDLRASHVFMETMDLLGSREDLFTKGRGVTYRRE